MNKDFPRIITLLRKERGFSQKRVAKDLSISPALLSHYEKGIRECGLDFIIKVSDYYDVSCDYLLGKTPDRSGSKITVEQIPENDPNRKDNVFKGGILSTLNKKLIVNSINIIFDLLQKSNNKNLINMVSSYFMVCIYKIFRSLYSGNKKNSQDFFGVPTRLQKGLTNAALSLIETNIDCLISGIDLNGIKKVDKGFYLPLSTDVISDNYPLFASSLYNLVQRAESSLVKNNELWWGFKKNKF